MVAKLKAQKRATVGSTGASLARSKSAGVASGVSSGAGEDKRAMLKKRLESFNKLKPEDGGAGAGAAAPPEDVTADPVEEEEPKKPVAPLKKAATEKALPSTRRTAADALLDKDSSDEETAAVPKKEFNVGDKLEAIYLEDGLWFGILLSLWMCYNQEHLFLSFFLLLLFCKVQCQD